MGGGGIGGTQRDHYLLSIHSARERDCIPIGGEHGKMSCSSLNRHVVPRSVVVLKVRFCVRDLASDLLRKFCTHHFLDSLKKDKMSISCHAYKGIDCAFDRLQAGFFFVVDVFQVLCPQRSLVAVF